MIQIYLSRFICFFFCLSFRVCQLQIAQLGAIPKNNYPIRFAYINRLSYYYPVQKLAASMGVPGYADQKIYNYYSYGFWRCADMPNEAALIWSSPIDHFGTDSVFGKTSSQIQMNIKAKFSAVKSQLLVSAFGPLQQPTTIGINPLDCAQQLANFVISNNFDGADVSWMDLASLQKGTGERWVITFQTQLRKLLPNHTIVHSVQAKYFKSDDYLNGGYVQINNKIGHTINFYNVLYYNQGVNNKYDSYQTLFQKSGGAYAQTSVMELNVTRNVDKRKIVVVKPVTPSDASSGFMNEDQLGNAVSKAYQTNKWYGGVGLWQYFTDVRGKAMTLSVGHLKELCTLNKDCK